LRAPGGVLGRSARVTHRLCAPLASLLREAEDLSQEAFADVLGVHRTYMGALERGERNLSLKSVEKIAGKLKIEPLLLLSDSGRVG
jgi:transcriptional regulator with XRE-family HTH domain